MLYVIWNFGNRPNYLYQENQQYIKHAYSLTDFLYVFFKGSSLSLCLAPSLFLHADRVILRGALSQTPAENRLVYTCHPRGRSGRRNPTWVAGRQSCTKFCLWRDSVPRQNSLFASLISFKGIWTQFFFFWSTAASQKANVSTSRTCLKSVCVWNQAMEDGLILGFTHLVAN